MVTKTSEHAQKLMRRVTTASLILAVFLLLLKTVAWVVTDSVAIQASLVDSLVDSIATGINFFAIRHALRPADDDHRFGHGKIEAVAAVGQSFFVAAAGLWVAFNAVFRFFRPEPVQETNFGLLVIILTILLTMGLVIYQKHAIKHSNSTVVKADHLHYKGDLFLNLAVIASLILGHEFQLFFIDPLCAFIIAGYIGFSAWQILKEGFDILIDRELPDAEKEIVSAVIKAHPKVVGFHDLKTRTSGQHRFIQLHLEMDGKLSLNEAHTISIEVVREIKEKIPQTEVLIHQDPHDDRDNEVEHGLL